MSFNPETEMTTAENVTSEAAAEPAAAKSRKQLVQEMLSHWNANLEHTIAEETSSGYLELSAAHPGGLAQLYGGRPTRLSNLVREPRALSHCRIRAREVLSASRDRESRYGSAPVYLAIGTASWRQGGTLGAAWERAASKSASSTTKMSATAATAVNAESDLSSSEDTAQEQAADSAVYDIEKVRASEPRTITGPALLCPVELSLTADEDVLITLDSAVEVWPPLEAALREKGEQAEIVSILQGLQAEVAFSPTNALHELRRLGLRHLLGFDLYDSLTVGQYLHPLSNLVKDFALNQDLLEQSDVTAALCGDVEAAGKVLSPLPQPVLTDRDPLAEHGIGDLDPAQHNVLDAVASGANLLLDAPPESEKTSTVAAILADAASAGRTIAYVPGARRRLQQVLGYLNRLGLESLTLDLSSRSRWRDLIPAKLLESLNAPEESEDPAADEATIKMRNELTQVRSQLGGYMEQLHRKRDPWQVSAYDALQVLADLTSMKPGPRTKVRFDLETLHRIASDGAKRAQELLAQAAKEGIFSQTRATNPWHSVVISSPEMVDTAVEGVNQLAGRMLPQVRADIDRAQKETGLLRAKNLNQWHDQLRMLDGLREAMDVFKPQIFERSAADMVIATATKKWRKERALNMKESQRRRLIKQAKDMVRPGRKVEDLHRELIRVQQQRRIWREYSPAGGWPVLPGRLDQMQKAEEALRGHITRLQPFFSTGFGDLMQMPLDELASLLDNLSQDEQGAERLPQRVAILKELHDLGLDELVDDLRERRVPFDLLRAELDLSWWASALAEMLRLDDRLAHFDGERLAELSARLRELDLAQVNSLSEQVLRQVRHQVAKLVGTQSETVSDLEQVLKDARSDLPEVIGQFPIVERLRPIRAIPPVLVPQILGNDHPVDLLVLDGVENTDLAEVIPAIARAKQVVVVGDVRRSEQGTISEFAGIFPQLTAPPTRSRVNEWVASFLADHDYGRDVMPVTVPRPSRPVTLTVVDGRGMPAPGAQCVETSSQEVEEVVRQVCLHAQTQSKESLGVVALTVKHARRISAAIMSEVARNPQLDKFLGSQQEEPFVIVDAAGAAGLRRDHVILSVGFAKTPHGQVLHDFGVISAADGTALLVDAVSMVRKELSLVSSMAPEAIDPQRLHHPGSQMLYDLLQAARAEAQTVGPVEAAQAMGEEESQPDRLLLDLAERLYSVGLTVIPNLGPKNGMRIPLAIGHPDYPDELLVAVLTDNPDYVAEKSLRRRERHWRQRLKEYGWVVSIVYSTAVFMDPAVQAQQLLDLVVDVVEERKKAQAQRQAVAAPAPAASPAPAVAVAPLPASSPVSQQRASEGNRSVQRPAISRGLPLTAYGDDQLDDLLAWIRSDDKTRSVEEEVDLLFSELGLQRRDGQVETILKNVVTRNA